MKPKIKIGQWWETRNGTRVYIIGITSQIPGIKRKAKQPIAWVAEDGYMNFCDESGKYGVQTQYEHHKDLKTLLPAECDSFDWKPEPKWRDARPEDVCQRGVDARFRDFDTNPWREGILLGCDFSAEYAWKCKSVGQYKYCQVQESQ